MNRHSAILMCAALLVADTSMAQHAPSLPLQKVRQVRSAGHPAAPTAQGARADAIWEDDFSNASNWTMSPLGGTTGNWVVGTTPPGGDPSYAIDPIASTTASNGFALYDSNLLCDDDSAYIQNATPIDLTDHPYVLLQFEQYYQNFQGRCWVQASNDGTTWSTWQVNGLLAVNEDTPNPETITVPITSVAGGQSTVWIRFVYAGNCDYAWMVDDVAIMEQPELDLSLQAVKTTMWDYVNTTSFDSLPYTVYPVSEIRPLGLNLTFTNGGWADATNVVASITTSDGYNESGTFASVPPEGTEQFVAPAYTPTTTLGERTISYALTSDGTDVAPEDNSAELTIAISENEFAVDAGAMDGVYVAQSSDDIPYQLINWFHVISDHTLYAITAVFPTTSATDAAVTAILYDDQRNPIAETVEHILAPEDLTAAGGAHFVPFLFDPPVALDANTDYAIGINHFGGSDVQVGTSGISAAGGSAYYHDEQSQWISQTATPMIRMSFDPTVGIAENDVRNGVGLGQSFPNPAQGNAIIDYSLVNGGMVSLELHDLNGKLVRTLVNGNTAQGVHRVTVSTNDLPEGVYTYTLTTGGTRTTKRMTVVH